MATDTIKPTLPSDTRITVSNVTSKGFTITWKTASDNVTPASKLRYQVCWYEIIPGATGYVPTPVLITGKTTHTFTNFKPGTEYGIYINLYDEAVNQAQYPLITQKTNALTSTTKPVPLPTTPPLPATPTRPTRPTRPTTPTKPSTPTTPSAPSADAARRKAINDYLQGLVYADDAIQKAIDNENRTTRVQGDYLVKYENVSRETAATELMMSCDAHTIFPGMFLVVDNNLGTLQPTQSGLARGKVKITIDFGNITLPNGNWRMVSADAGGNLMSNVNHAINEMVEDFRKSRKTLTANFTDRTTYGQSQDEMKVKVGASGSFAGIKASASFEQNQSSFAMQYMTDYTQIFYTVTAEINKKDYSTLFDEHVTVDMIKRSFGNKPIIFVKSVKYGRQLYLLEELSGSNKELIQSCSVSGYGCSIKQNFSKSSSKVDYKKTVTVRGGGLPNGNSIISNTNLTQNEEELDIDFCKRQMAAVRKEVEKFKTTYTNVKLDGTIENDVYGVPLSYSAERLEGINQKNAIFWKQGTHQVKRLIPNTGIRIDVFNCLKEGNIVASGWFTKFDNKGNELSTVYDVQFDINHKGSRSTHTVVGTLSNGVVKLSKDLVDGGKNNHNGRVFTKSFMTPPFQLPKNVYRVCLKIRHRDKSARKFEYTYILPYGNIMAGYLRSGKGGGECVNWFFGGRDDDWYNGGEK